MDLQAIIFDVDGTIAETEEIHRQAFNKVFKDVNTGWEWSPELYRELLLVPGGRERIRAYVARFHPALLAYENTDRLISAIHRDKTAQYIRAIRQGACELRPGVMRLLTEARQRGVRLAIASTTSRANVQGLLRYGISARALEWFEVIGTAEDVVNKKPAPDIYRHVLMTLGLPPSACIAIEDSANGLAAASGAGVPTVVTVNGYTEDQNFAGAVAVLDDLGEPGRGFRVRRGDDHGKSWVDLDLLRRWHAEGQQMAAE